MGTVQRSIPIPDTMFRDAFEPPDTAAVSGWPISAATALFRAKDRENHQATASVTSSHPRSSEAV